MSGIVLAMLLILFVMASMIIGSIKYSGARDGCLMPLLTIGFMIFAGKAIDWLPIDPYSNTKLYLKLLLSAIIIVFLITQIVKQVKAHDEKEEQERKQKDAELKSYKSAWQIDLEKMTLNAEKNKTANKEKDESHTNDAHSHE